MRRKTRNSDANPTPEKTSRRSTRRGRKSPSPSPNPEEEEKPVQESEAPVEEPPLEETPPKRKGRRANRTPSAEVVIAPVVTPRRGRGRKKAEPVIEEIVEAEEVVDEGAPIEEPQDESESQEDEKHVVDTQESEVPLSVEEETIDEITETVELLEEKVCEQIEDEPMELHPEEEESQQPSENLETAQNEENSRDKESKKVANPDEEAEEGEVVDGDSSDEVSLKKIAEESEEEPQKSQKPPRKMRRTTERRVSSEQNNFATDATTVDHQINNKDTENTTILAEVGNKEKAPRQRKRKWLTQKSTDTKPAIISISTDSLKDIIKDTVKPVPLADVQLDLTPERKQKEVQRSVSPELELLSDKKRKIPIASNDADIDTEQSKIDDEAEQEKQVPKPLTPPKYKASNILFIRNLVRPFTILQLKGLLARTGKIVENGFWIDKIKSKCYVRYETEDEAIETRHALHGVKWPASNPKNLHVDFGRESEMEKAIMSTLEETVTRTITNDTMTGGTESSNAFGWSKADALKSELEERVKDRPVREWDLGKQRSEEKERDRRERDKEKERDREVRENRRERKRTPERQRSQSSPLDQRQKKKEDEPPLRLLDDLFRKTKATPCIYWLPLTPEQIQEKEQLRKKRLEEHERRMELQRKEREEEIKKRQRERERRRSAERERERDRDKRRRSRSRSRSGHSRSRSRSRDNRRRYR